MISSTYITLKVRQTQMYRGPETTGRAVRDDSGSKENGREKGTARVEVKRR